jgi:hypothetical protein
VKRAARLILIAAPAMLVAASGWAGSTAGNHPAIPGVSNPARARVDYMLKCQGCHHPDGSGNIANTPPLTGEVGKFLAVPGGREFLGRVPGVASTDLDDVRLAELLNWTLYTFDRGHMPANFSPYSAEELGALRKQPLRLERAEMRESLIRAIANQINNQPN